MNFSQQVNKETTFFKDVIDKPQNETATRKLVDDIIDDQRNSIVIHNAPKLYSSLIL